MADGGDLTWRGTRTPNRSLALGVFAIAIALLSIAVFRWSYLGDPVNWWFMTVFVVFLLVYAALVLTSLVDVTLELGEDAIIIDVREHAVGRQVRQRTHRVRRTRMARVVERVMSPNIHTVRIEDGSGRTLVSFPRFLDIDEHDRMVRAILVWGDHDPSKEVPGSSPEPGVM